METKRNKIGFFFYNEQETQITTEELVINPLEHIGNVIQPQLEVVVTPAHKEALDRIEMVKSTIKGEKFPTFSDEKKQEFLNELTWLTEISTQLNFSY